MMFIEDIQGRVAKSFHKSFIRVEHGHGKGPLAQMPRLVESGRQIGLNVSAWSLFACLGTFYFRSEGL